MKRILSLILALLLCCGFIVSCEKEEVPLSGEESVGVKLGEASVNYYYHRGRKREISNGELEEKICLVESRPELFSCISEMGLSASADYDLTEITPQVFESSYVLVVLQRVGGAGSSEERLGYRDLELKENGLMLVLDVCCTVSGRYFLGSDGKVNYDDMAEPDAELEGVAGQGGGGAVVACDIVVIPKTSIDYEISKDDKINLVVAKYYPQKNNLW